MSMFLLIQNQPSKTASDISHFSQGVITTEIRKMILIKQLTANIDECGHVSLTKLLNSWCKIENAKTSNTSITMILSNNQGDNDSN